MFIKKISYIFIFLLVYVSSFSQIWEEEAYKKNENATFYDLVESFNNHRKNIPYEKGNGYKPYARNIDFLEKRINENGVFHANALWEEWKKIKNQPTT